LDLGRRGQTKKAGSRQSRFDLRHLTVGKNDNVTPRRGSSASYRFRIEYPGICEEERSQGHDDSQGEAGNTPST
jgi:hypothetical protein